MGRTGAVWRRGRGGGLVFRKTWYCGCLLAAAKTRETHSLISSLSRSPDEPVSKVATSFSVRSSSLSGLILFNMARLAFFLGSSDDMILVGLTRAMDFELATRCCLGPPRIGPKADMDLVRGWYTVLPLPATGEGTVYATLETSTIPRSTRRTRKQTKR